MRNRNTKASSTLLVSDKGKNIVELLGLTAFQVLGVFEDAKLRKHLKVMGQMNLSYLTLKNCLDCST